MHGSQKEIASDDQSATFEYMIKPTYAFYQEMLAISENAEIIEPESVREEMSNITNGINYRYNGKESKK